MDRHVNPVMRSGDGVTELAVGADGFPSGEFYGTVYILFMNKDGTVRTPPHPGHHSLFVSLISFVCAEEGSQKPFSI